MATDHHPPAPPRGFGTFGGVFTPCVLTILGVIMFLRFGQVVGEAGILRALLIVALAKAITTCTALSLSAIATNTKVQGGGAYFLISRSLGVETGGAIGLVFFCSQAISVAMYVIGFTEAFLATFPGLALNARAVGSLVNVGVFLCVVIGAGWTIKVQYGILAVLALSILSFVAGAIPSISAEHIAANWGAGFAEGSSFFAMFALFFPAATGIMAGANMSGDLRNPAQAIPAGTLWAIAVTGVIYLIMAFLLGAAGERGQLLGNPLVVMDLSLIGILITAGIFAATLSSALGSLMGAPRILQALARDRIFPSLAPLAVTSGADREPRRAIVVSFLIAQVGVLLGDLNAIAPIITMFFMITYGALNFATFQEAFARNPSWRPSFRWCHWGVSLGGAVACLAVMFLMEPLWAAIALLAMWALHAYVAQKDIEAAWGDVQSGAALERARRNLLALEQGRYHPKNWRPCILALGATNRERLHLAVYGQWLGGGHGVLFLGQVITGEVETYAERQTRQTGVVRRFIGEQGLQAFPAVTVAASLSAGVNSLVQCCGIGAVHPNLVLMGWSASPERRADFTETLVFAHRLRRSAAILRLDARPRDPWYPPSGPIDIWWRGQDNGPLMLLLAHLLRRNAAWRTRTIRLRRILAQEAGREEIRTHLEKLAREARIEVQCSILVAADAAEAMRVHSAAAALVIVGFDLSVDETDAEALHVRLAAIAEGLPRVLLVHSAGDMELAT